MAVTYEQLAPVLYGNDAVEEMAKQAAALGKKMAFICCDKGVKAAGAADKVQAAFAAAGLGTYVFDGCIPDAPDTLVYEIAKLMADQGTDLIVGLGGGSSLDAAKAAGVVMDNGGSVRTYMEENGNPGFVVKTPAYVVPTSAGTGSECTPMCVIHEVASNTKKVVLRKADLAVLDPTLTVSCPPSVTVNSGMDALSHALEAYLSVNDNPKDMILAINAIELIAENLPKAVADPQDLAARGNMMVAANFAGIAIAAMSVHVGHCFAHEVGIHFGLNHGLCCALSAPETVRFVAEAKPQGILDVAKAMKIAVPEGISAKEAGEVIAAGMREFMHKIGVKSLKEMGVDRDELLGIAKDAIDHNWFHVMCPGDVSYEQMAQFMADVYDNY